jgi:radical SAM superfamily enzyme YgiQ (UPF0313 family)
MPPLALGILQGYLRHEGFDVISTDLNIRLRELASKVNREVWAPIFMRNLVLKYLDMGSDPEIDPLLDMLLDGVAPDSGDLFGISIGADFSWFEIHTAFLLGKMIKDRWGKIVVFGGNNIHYLLQFSEEFEGLWSLVIRNFEYILVGPGERSLTKLIRELNELGCTPGFRSLPGAVWAGGNKIVGNHQDLPTLHKPDYKGIDLTPYKVCLNKSEPWEQTEMINLIHYYKWPFPYNLTASEFNRSRLTDNCREEALFIPYIFNYNCPFRCAFCVQSGNDKQKAMIKDVSVIINEIESMITEYDTKYFYFFNNTFNYKPSFVYQFCNEVLTRGLKFYWSDCARFNNLNEELIDLIYRSGCRKLVFGFETGSEKLLNLYDKQLDLDHARKVLKWCHDAGIWADIEVIVGLPHENEEDFRATADFIIENQKYITYFTLNRYFVIPDSLIGSRPSNYNIKLVKIRNRYDKLLERNLKLFLDAADANTAARNFQMYRYNELDGRSHDIIVKETTDKINRLSKLYAFLEVTDEIQVHKIVGSTIAGKGA